MTVMYFCTFKPVMEKWKTASKMPKTSDSILPIANQMRLQSAQRYQQKNCKVNIHVTAINTQF